MPYDFSKIPISRFEDTPCGYFSDRTSTTIGLYTNWIMDGISEDFPLKNYFEFMLKNGYRRSSSLLYNQICEGCKECIPIRISVKDFVPSKSQKAVWRKNQDLELRIKKSDSSIRDFASDEKALMFRQYAAHSHDTCMSFEEARQQILEMHFGYSGVFDMEYYIGEKLVAVGIIDAAENEKGEISALSSNYFYYDVSEPFLKRSLGVFSVLKEIELCRQLGCEFYYLGLYLPNCKKMNYKSKFKPYQLLIDGEWVGGVENALGGVAERPQRSEDLQQAPDGEDTSRNAQKKQINKNMIYEIPLPPKDDEFNNDICLVTKDIPLQLLYSAYMQGIFPWFNEDEQQPVMWFSPDPRFVIFPEVLHVSKSIKKFLKKSPYTYTFDKAFEDVIRGCRNMKRDEDGTWIGEKMIQAYIQFHKEGFAHSIEVWHENRLVGGFYGVLIGSVFCGESMFTIEPDSSKSAFVLFAKAFEKCGGMLIDCQCYTDNMARYGAVEIPRDEFLSLEREYLFTPLKGDLKATFLEMSGEHL